MGMKRYGLVWGLVLLGLVAVGGWYWMTNRVEPEDVIEVGDNLEISEEVLERFRGMGEVSDTAERVELRPVEGESGFGVATREVMGGRLYHSVMADLPELGNDEFYEGWLIDGERRVNVGKLVKEKGGWLLEFVGDEGLVEYDLVVITLEVRDDKSPEKEVLKGTFK